MVLVCIAVAYAYYDGILPETIPYILLASIAFFNRKNSQEKTLSTKMRKGISASLLFVVVLMFLFEEEMAIIFGYTDIHTATKRGQVNRVASLLESGIDPNLKTKTFEKTPLHFFLQSGWNDSSKKVATLLIDAGADINARDHLGGTPLFETILQSRVLVDADDVNNAVSFLLDRGAEINAKDTFGRTPLHLALLGRGDISLLSLLLDRGADINDRDFSGRTPLNIAIKRNNSTKLFVFLIDRGARLHTYASSYKISSLLEDQCKKYKIHIDLMKTSNNTPESMLKIQNKALKKMSSLIEKKPRIITEREKIACLHILGQTIYNPQRMVSFLLNLGVDINAKNKTTGMNIIHYI